MKLVVDASVAVKWLVAEQDSPAAVRLIEAGHELHAPRLLAAEVTNVLWRKARIGELERRDASPLTGAVPDMPVRWTADEALCAVWPSTSTGRSTTASTSRYSYPLSHRHA